MALIAHLIAIVMKTQAATEVVTVTEDAKNVEKREKKNVVKNVVVANGMFARITTEETIPGEIMLILVATTAMIVSVKSLIIVTIVADVRIIRNRTERQLRIISATAF